MRDVQLDATAEEYLAGGATIFITETPKKPRAAEATSAAPPARDCPLALSTGRYQRGLIR
jgi:hypothetical protein